jgi:glycosyltransferase involved in cell wall biosynthesis
MIVVAFLGETFYLKDDCYSSMPPNSKFLQMTFGEDNVKVISPVSDDSKKLKIKNSNVKQRNFYSPPMPANCSTKVFYKKVIFQRNFYKKFKLFCDKVIDDNPNAIFWARTPSPGSIIFALRVIKKQKKIIHHICGDAKETWRDKKYKGLTKILAFFFSKIVLAQQRKIISYHNTINLTSGSKLFKFSKKYSSKTYQFLDVISNGINREKKIFTKTFNFTFIGRIVDDKGVFDLVHAFNFISANKIYKCNLNLIGDGPDLEKLNNIILKLKLKNKIKLHGMKNQQEISELLSISDCVVIPSKTNEGFPRVIFEAWSHYVPIIVSNIGGISAFVLDEKNSLIIKPGSINDLKVAMIKIMKPQFRETIINNINLNYQKISTQKYWSSTLLKIIKKIV